MYNKLLSLFGLVRAKDVRDLTAEPYTDEEIDSLYINVAYSRAEGFDKDKYDHMLDLLKQNKDFAQFLDWTIVEDTKRAFNVTDLERPVVRGAVSRTRYLRSLCNSTEDGNNEMRKKISRYAK